MFTWEEAGQLRQMLLIVFWASVFAVLGGVAFVEREPLEGAVKAGLHRIQSSVHAPSHG